MAQTRCARCSRFMLADRSDSMPLAGSTTGERVHLPNRCPKIKTMKVAPKAKLSGPSFEDFVRFAKSDGTNHGKPLGPMKIGPFYFIPKGWTGRTVSE